MRRLIYDVAMTLDNFICREDGSCEGFVTDEEHVPDYQARLATYSTVVMGRKTYEFGYAFGLEPGKRAYPHMEHVIFSRTLAIDSEEIQITPEDPVQFTAALKQKGEGDIYLCGGGELAGQLLAGGLIDELAIKLNPVCFGAGRRVFGECLLPASLTLLESKPYNNGVVFLRYQLENSRVDP